MSILFLAALMMALPFTFAGDLEPPAPPASTMKTLSEVEPRIPIPASDTPTGTFTISQSGSYYLTGNRLCSGHGIRIEADGVTIDLMGYSLIGPGPGSSHGILVSNAKNMEIRNGTIRDFGLCGIYDGSSAAEGNCIVDVRVLYNSAGSDLWAGMILGGSGYLVKDCTAIGNGGAGFFVSSGCNIIGNVAYSNGGDGVYASHGCTIMNNTSSYNAKDGIEAYSNCNIIANNCYKNGHDDDGAGIHITGSKNRIEQNNVTDNDRGIDVDSNNNLIVKNSAGGNTTEYDIVAGNKTGAISTDPTTAGPWDNFDL